MVVSRVMSVCALCALLLPGCNSKTKYDVFLEGQKIEGEAERGPCKLHYTDNSPAAKINSTMVAQCLEETNKAIALYEKAQEMGYEGDDVQSVYDRALQRRTRLESMLEMVRKMERDQNVPDQPF